MPYDCHPLTIDWFERALSADNPELRWRAVEILRYTDGPRRSVWLKSAEQDPDPRVAMTAVLVSAALDESLLEPGDDLFESDFADSGLDASLDWEWEYTFVVCHGLYAPTAGWVVWVREENDEEARRLALLKANVGVPEPAERIAIMMGKRFVNRYTRAARSFAEAMRWRDEGRPRYSEGL